MSFKSNTFFAFIVIAGLIAVSFTLTQTNEVGTAAETIYIQNTYVVDLTDDNKLVGSANNVFVGRVVEEVGTKTDRSQPQTQFDVEVIENIKGNLKGNIIVNHEAGLKEIDGKNYLYITEGDSLIKPDNEYLFVTRYSDTNDWYTVAPAYGKLLITDEMEKQNQVKRFERAFANEVPLNLEDNS